MKNQFGVSEVNEVMRSRGITRKSAVRFLSRDRKTGGTKAAVAPAKDVKMAAANDKTLPVFGPTPTKAKAPKPEVKLLTPEQRGKARAEGLRLFVLAGKPKKQDFVKVFGKRGPAMVWTARAKAVGLDNAEACAAKFQSLLRKAL